MSRVRNLVLLLLVIVCGLSFWMARRPGADQARPTVVERPAVAPPAPVATVHLAVLNGTSESGLARRVSRLLPPLGCVVVTVADAPHDTFARSLLVNRRLDPDQARQLARRLADPTLVTEWDARCDEDAVLVLGRDHARILAQLGTDR